MRLVHQIQELARVIRLSPIKDVVIGRVQHSVGIMTENWPNRPAAFVLTAAVHYFRSFRLGCTLKVWRTESGSTCKHASVVASRTLNCEANTDAVGLMPSFHACVHLAIYPEIHSLCQSKIYTKTHLTDP